MPNSFLSVYFWFIFFYFLLLALDKSKKKNDSREKQISILLGKIPVKYLIKFCQLQVLESFSWQTRAFVS